jgi:uncharacterized membrane protein
MLAVPVIVVVRWVVLSQRFTELERRIADVSQDQVTRGELAVLLRRVYQLEGTVAGMKSASPAQPTPPPQPKPAPPIKLEEPAVAPPPATVAFELPKTPPTSIPIPPLAATHASVIASQPSPTLLSRDREAAVEQPVPQAPPAKSPAIPPPPFLSGPPIAKPEPARPARSSEEWEAVVGGNWLNKLGIFVLVIAIALFLGYSFTQMGPAGRSAIGLVVSLALFLGGVVLERRARYVLFGRGLISGGWAGLYLTVYAMQAVDAAKVIHNPILGAVLLLAVATGMVVHSLRYRVQALTGLAYAAAFGALALTPVTALSVIALIPLAGSLLVIAYRFSWSGMALFGLVATYATCASRGDNGAPLWSTQSVFAAYWLLFEAYDLLRARRRSSHPAELAILPLNALAFAALSYAKWSAARPADIYVLAAGIAAAYLADTILRTVLRPPSSFPPETTTLERVFAGGYEGPITLAAACSVVAAVLKLHGQTVNAVLLAEAEALFLAALVFRQNYPRRLAGTLFASLGVKLFFTDIPTAGVVHFARQTLQDWTPNAAVAAFVFYCNRALRKPARTYSLAASAVVVLMLGFEIPLRHLGLIWLGFATLLFLFGWRFRLSDFRLQGYLSGALSLGAVWLYQDEIFAGSAPAWPYAWIPLAVSAVVSYLAALCALRSAADRFAAIERTFLQAVSAAVASAAAAALLWKVLPAVYLGPAWIALAILALELGLRRWPADLRPHAHILAALGALQVWFVTVLPFHPLVRTDERIAIAAAALAAYSFAARFFFAAPDQAPARESRGAVNVATACGSLFVLVELWALLPSLAVAPAWTLFALLLTEIGLRAKLPALRVQGHLVAATAFTRLCSANLEPGGYVYGVSQRVWTVSVVIASHYFAWWRQNRSIHQLGEPERGLGRAYLYTAAGLVAGLLYLELRPPFVAVAWAVLALLFLSAGRFRRLPDLRYQSYALAAIAFTRAMALELFPALTFSSTAQRIAVGAVVVACLFVAQLLVPRTEEKSAAGFGARLFLSLLATFLATALLYQEVSGSMLTVAWGLEGAFLLGAGFPLRDRTMRLSGLALFLVCIGKLFAYDLRNLETLYRILSFFVLGVILLGVSWIYTRFRDRISQYL